MAQHVLADTRVAVQTLHPGYVATSFGGKANRLKARLRNLLLREMIIPGEGAKTVTYLAASPSVEGITGKYFYDCREIRSSEQSYDEVSAERLWVISEELVGLRSKQEKR